MRNIFSCGLIASKRSSRNATASRAPSSRPTSGGSSMLRARFTGRFLPGRSERLSSLDGRLTANRADASLEELRQRLGHFLRARVPEADLLGHGATDDRRERFGTVGSRPLERERLLEENAAPDLPHVLSFKGRPPGERRVERGSEPVHVGRDAERSLDLFHLFRREIRGTPDEEPGLSPRRRQHALPQEAEAEVLDEAVLASVLARDENVLRTEEIGRAHV